MNELGIGKIFKQDLALGSGEDFLIGIKFQTD